MSISIADATMVEAYNALFAKCLKTGVDKKYPNLSLVRLISLYFHNKTGKVLDYGCGFGANLIHMAECGYEVKGVDTSPQALERIQQKLAEKPAISAQVDLQQLEPEVNRLPFEDNSFDYIVCSSVLSLLSSVDRIKHMLNEFRRVIKTAGKLYLDINGPQSDFALSGKPMGNDVYEFKGHDGRGVPRLIYCPSTKEEFAELVSHYFTVDEIGFHQHSFFTSHEQEFIVCAQKK